MDEGGQNENLTAVMESMGIYDTDLRARGNTNTSAVSETQRLLKILLATLNKAVAQGSVSADSNHGEPSTGSGRVEPVYHDPDHRKQNEPPSQTNYAEVRCKQLIGLLFWNIFSYPKMNKYFIVLKKIYWCVLSVQEDMDCSPGSPFSPGSPPEQKCTSENTTWDIPANEGT